jgi:hypothetical protein
MPLRRSRESDFSRNRTALRTHFLHLGQPKMRFRRVRGSDVSRGLVRIQTDFLPGQIVNCSVFDDDFSRGLLALKLIFFLLGDVMWDFGEVKKGKFHGVACSCELIFCFLDGLICDLGRSRSNFQGSAVFTSSCSTFYVTLARWKKWCFNRSSSAVNPFFLLVGTKCDFC